MPTLVGCGAVPNAVTETQTVTHQAATPAAPAQWTGNGTRNLGTFTVPTDSVLRWTINQGSVISVTSDPTSDYKVIAISSQANGESVVAAGTYTNVQVISTGDWALTLG